MTVLEMTTLGGGPAPVVSARGGGLDVSADHRGAVRQRSTGLGAGAVNENTGSNNGCSRFAFRCATVKSKSIQNGLHSMLIGFC